MKLAAVILENFRGYAQSVRIEIDDLTAFIGRNDAGKSTILEALEIFFNDGKPERGDACVHGKACISLDEQPPPLKHGELL
ncbi:ATP-binding protein [Burkholderia multivorans]|nr:ATP-binding protein [Burkholderia multivorans]HEF4753692.1 AAA family ATPase [Burkholderia multivorans]